VALREVVASITSVVRHARVVVQQKLRAAEAAEGIRRAHTLDQVREQLAALAADMAWLAVELLPPSATPLPPRAAHAVRWELPLRCHTPQGRLELVLRVWSPRPAPGVHPGAERVASRVWVAVEEWLTRHGTDLAPLPHGAPDPGSAAPSDAQAPVTHTGTPT
jgi:hypothetical protein